MRFVCVWAIALLASVPAVAATARPAVRIVELQPVTLKGSGFRSYERVRVTVRVGERSAVSKRLQVGRLGRFSVTFREFTLGRCGNELAMTAVGSRGSRVSWVLGQPACFDE